VHVVTDSEAVAAFVCLLQVPFTTKVKDPNALGHVAILDGILERAAGFSTLV
jgi:hypothetical protein